MAEITVELGQLSETLAEQLALYTVEVANEVKKAVDETASELLKNIKRDAPVRTGTYKKSMKTKIVEETQYTRVRQWYVAGDKSNISSWLEHGHLIKATGGRSGKYPHIIANEKKAKETLEKRIKEAIDNAGKN